MSLKTKAIKGVFWSAFEKWGSRLISAVVFFLLARLLGPKTFGLVALVGVYLAFTNIFLDQGFSQALVQRKELAKEHIDTAFWTNLIVSFALTAISISGAEWIALIFKEEALAPIIRWLSLTFVLSALSNTQQALLQRKLAFKSLTIRTLIAVTVSGIVGVTMAFRGFGVWSLVGQQLTYMIVQVAVLWCASDWRPEFSFSRKHFKELFSFGLNIMGNSFFNFFNRRSDDFLIGYFLGPTALGYYTVAYRLLLILTDLLIRTTEQVAIPTFSRMQHNLERVRTAFYQVTQLTSLIAFPLFISSIVLAPEIVDVMFGEEWKASIPVMQVLGAVGIVHSISFFNGAIMVSMGKPEWKLRLNIVNAVTNVIGFLLVVQWGIVAVASACAIGAALVLPFSVVVVHKLIDIDIKKYIYQYSTGAVGSAVMAIAVLACKFFFAENMNVIALIPLCILVGASTYLATGFLINPSLFQKLWSSIVSIFSLSKA